LLSGKQLIKKGFKVIFKNKWCLIKNNKGKMYSRYVKMRAKDFALNLAEKEQIAFAINIDNEELLHRKLRHFHHAGLMYMHRHNLVRDVSRLKNGLTNCAAC
jgi:hypothetical protein